VDATHVYWTDPFRYTVMSVSKCRGTHDDRVGPAGTARGRGGDDDFESGFGIREFDVLHGGLWGGVGTANGDGELRAHVGSRLSRLPRTAGRSPPVTRDAAASAAARNFASGRASAPMTEAHEGGAETELIESACVRIDFVDPSLAVSGASTSAPRLRPSTWMSFGDPRISNA
jgi:hypothetical protein